MPTVDHPEWAAFQRAIVADPDDDAPRLVFADWMDEHDRSQWASLIRLQIELARLEQTGQGQAPAAEALRRKEREYLRPVSVDLLFWAVDACPGLVEMSFRPYSAIPTIVGADRVTFRRGFVEEVTCTAAEWLRHGQAVRERQPIRDLRLARCDAISRDQWYQMIPALTGLREVVPEDAPDWLAEWFRYWVPGVAMAGS